MMECPVWRRGALSTAARAPTTNRADLVGLERSWFIRRSPRCLYSYVIIGECQNQ